MVIYEYIKGDITFPSGETFAYTENNIVNDSVSIQSQCCDDSSFSIGGVYSAQLTMDIIIPNTNSFNIIGSKITVFTRYGSESDFVQRGVFWITSADRYKDVYSISASDNMIWLDTASFTNGSGGTTFSDPIHDHFVTFGGNLTTFLSYLIANLNSVVPSQAQLSYAEPTDEVINNNNTYYLKDETGTTTTRCPRDYASYLAELCAGYVYAKPNGSITFGRFYQYLESETPVTIFLSEIEQDTSNVADFVVKTFLVQSNLYDNSWGKTWYNKDYSQVEMPLIIENNPFLDGFMLYNKVDICDYITTPIHGVLNSNPPHDDKTIVIRPFSLKCHKQHRFQLGEHVYIENGNYSPLESTVTSITWYFRGGYQLGCTGKDTRILADVLKSSIATQIKRISERKIDYVKQLAVGENLTQSEFDELSPSDLIEGKNYYIYDEES